MANVLASPTARRKHRVKVFTTLRRNQLIDSLTWAFSNPCTGYNKHPVCHIVLLYSIQDK